MIEVFKPKRIIHKWLKLLELTNYRAKCSVRNPKEVKGLRKGDAAMIDIALGERRLNIYLNRSDRRTWNEKLIVHELTHVFLYRMWEFVDQLVQKSFRGRKAQEALKAAYESLEEETVDRLVAIFLKLRRRERKEAVRKKKPSSCRERLAA